MQKLPKSPKLFVLVVVYVLRLHYFLLFSFCFLFVSSIFEKSCISSLLQKCPYDAIKIINLPSNLSKDTTHRYSQNSFKLHRLPTPRAGEVFTWVFIV